MTERQPTASFLQPPPAENTPLTANTGHTPTSAPAAPPGEGLLPRAFGRYELRRLLGRGGMGRVYLAHDPQLDRLVALKMPNPVALDGWRERFFAEARAAATLTHANVCPVYDVGEADGQPYLTMAFIEGETLAEKLARDGTFAPGDAVALVETVARAMHEAHKRGIVHRDLKPANLMLDTSGRPLITDFGLAIRSTATDDLRLTLTGVALGTPAYMPPEQAGGDHDAIGPTADVYSLGVILYELVTGRVPFKAKSFGKLLAQIERDAPPVPSSFNAAVDPALEAIILTALAKRPTDRFETAGDFANALARYQEGDRNGLISRFSRPYLIPEPTAEFRPQPASTAEFRKPRRARWLAGAAVLFALVAVAASVIYVQTDYGELEVRLSDPTAKVDVRVNGQTVTLDSGGKLTHVKVGPNQKLEVTSADFETVTESFDLKRGGVTIVRVTLNPIPKKKDAVKPPDPAVPPKKDKEGTPLEPDRIAGAITEGFALAAPAVTLKPVEFPKAPTLIEAAGSEILADATKAEMQTWLDGKKKAKHSVVWLDVVSVDGKPVYSGVAVPDDRVGDWAALLDESVVGGIEVSDALKAAVKGRRFVALSGYPVGSELRCALLLHPGNTDWTAFANKVRGELAGLDDDVQRNGNGYVSFRPYAGFRGLTTFAVIAEPMEKGGEKAFDLSAADLEKFAADQRKAGHRLSSVTAYPGNGNVKFAAVSATNPRKWEWVTDTGLTAAELKVKAAESAGKGFRPSSVTAYGWDGAVRYCAVWVKEPPKPTPYPKGPTLIAQGGYEILTDATKEEMRKWLDDRKEAKHSVMWLDACEVAGKPLFSAVAALDDREAKWKALLDVSVDDFRTGKISNHIGAKTDHPISASGYLEAGKVKSVTLWRNELLPFYIDPDSGPAGVKIADDASRGANGVIRAIRPYPVGDGVAIAVFGHRAVGEKATTYLVAADADALAEFLKTRRDAGERGTSLAAYQQEGKIVFAVVGASTPEKISWQTDTNLTTTELKAKAADYAKTGFRPSCVTAYPWDGAVRYCVVWVKEPPKLTPYPPGPTLVEVPGWQMLTNATKEEMKKWLDEKQKAKHSVMWLDATSVEGKPLYCAVAALDDRLASWTALLDIPISDLLDQKKLNALVDIKKNRIVSYSGFTKGTEMYGVVLFHPGEVLWMIGSPRSVLQVAGAIEEGIKIGGQVPVLRAFPVKGSHFYVMTLELNPPGGKPVYKYEMTADDLDAYLKDHRSKGYRPSSVSAVPGQEQVSFAAVMVPDSTKAAWEVHQNLTADALKVKTTEMTKRGFTPTCLTAYGWDGKTRYCAIWVKEPPKEKDKK